MSEADRTGESTEANEEAQPAERIPSTIAVHGHPLHPMLITFPIALLISVLVTDTAFWWSGDAFWSRMSFWLLVGGLTGGTLAALSGMADFMIVKEIREHVASWSHFILAVMAMSVAAGNLMLRWDDPAGAVLPWGFFMSGLNVFVLSIAGWMGGNLVFRHLIGTGSK